MKTDGADAIELLSCPFDGTDDPIRLAGDIEWPRDGKLVGTLDDFEDSAELDGDEATLLLDKTKDSDEKEDSSDENLEKLSEVVNGVDSTELEPILCTDDGGGGAYSGPPLQVYDRLTWKINKKGVKQLIIEQENKFIITCQHKYHD